MRRNLQPGDIIVLRSFNDIVMLIDGRADCDIGPYLWTCLLTNGCTEEWPDEWIATEMHEVV